MSILWAAAVASILARGPTRIGTMIPSSAASTGPRSELSSQGWTTTVLAAGTFLAEAIRRSYFACGRSWAMLSWGWAMDGFLEVGAGRGRAGAERRDGPDSFTPHRSKGFDLHQS